MFLTLSGREKNKTSERRHAHRPLVTGVCEWWVAGRVSVSRGARGRRMCVAVAGAVRVAGAAAMRTFLVNGVQSSPDCSIRSDAIRSDPHSTLQGGGDPSTYVKLWPEARAFRKIGVCQILAGGRAPAMGPSNSGPVQDPLAPWPCSCMLLHETDKN